VRGLGHIHLCGVLHVCWQTREGVDGQYLICLLYRDFLLLASAPKAEQVFNVQACISLSDIRVEEVDNGRGMFHHPHQQTSPPDKVPTSRAVLLLPLIKGAFGQLIIS
jgi:hypothetical protein